MARIGDIFVATWGYDQTNANFFQVVKVTSKSVSVRPIKSRRKEDPPGSMSGYAMPIKNSFTGSAKTKRIYYYDGREMFKASESMGSAEKWDGKPVAISWYA